MYFAIAVFGIWLVFVCASPAYAYIDPGSGGMIVQLLLGGVAGLVVLARLYWHRFLKSVGLRKPDTSPEQ